MQTTGYLICRKCGERRPQSTYHCNISVICDKCDTCKPFSLNYRHSRTGWSCRAEFQTLESAVAHRESMGLSSRNCRIMRHVSGRTFPAFGK